MEFINSLLKLDNKWRLVLTFAIGICCYYSAFSSNVDTSELFVLNELYYSRRLRSFSNPPTTSLPFWADAKIVDVANPPLIGSVGSVISKETPIFWHIPKGE